MTRENTLRILRVNNIPIIRQSISPYTDEYLLNRLKELEKELGRTPLVKDMDGRKPSVATYFYRFGGFVTALKLAGIKATKVGPDKYMINRLKELANEVGRTPTLREMRIYKPDPMSYIYHFGSLHKARELAGLKPNKIGAPFNYTDEQLLNKLSELAKQLGRTPTWRDLHIHKLPSSTTYHARFGSLRHAQEMVGLKPNKNMRGKENKYSDEYLLNQLKELAKKLGRTPTVRDLHIHKLPNASTYYNHFGSFSKSKKLIGL